MKKLLTYSLILLTFLSCRREEITNADDSHPVLQFKPNIVATPVDIYTEQQVKDAAIDSLQHEKDFRWIDADIKLICSGAEITKLVAVGYKPATFSRNVNDVMHTIDIHSAEWKNVHDQLIGTVKRLLEEQGVSSDDVVYEDDVTLPIVVFRTDNKIVLTSLYNLENVRYIEPYGFWPYPQSCSSSGCSASTTTVNPSDISSIQPACILPWNYNNLNIPAAWSSATGDGIKIGVIDAGISNVQSLLGSQFASGYSNNGRTVTLDYTYGSSAYSSCTHGTSMCGLAAGPRNSVNAPTGVAYKSSLHFIRACDDVVLDAASELTGVKNALVKMGNITSVKIISMSVGTPFYSSVLYDGVSYAYGKGKMIFAAAGTSFSFTSWWGVIYPAALSQCIAVTGVKENGNKCTTCHDGSQVRFTIPMERDIDNNRHGVSLPFSGYSPNYIGGSSCATATCAGIAAVVWSVNPNLTRTQIYDCLRLTAQYPTPVTNKGFGNPNAGAAVARAATL
jgi:serine protease